MTEATKQQQQKTGDLFKKIRDTKGTFHARMGVIKDRHSKDLTEAEESKRWKRYIEELHKKGLSDPHNHDGVVTHLESDILECEVKGALGTIIMNKASGGDGIPAELFQILKDDSVEVLHSICQEIWKTHQWSLDWKRSIFIPVPKKAMLKNVQTSICLCSFYMLAKFMLKILQALLPQYMNQELANVQAEFQRKQIQLPTLLDHGKGKGITEKHLFLLH